MSLYVSVQREMLDGALSSNPSTNPNPIYRRVAHGFLCSSCTPEFDSQNAALNNFLRCSGDGVGLTKAYNGTRKDSRGIMGFPVHFSYGGVHGFSCSSHNLIIGLVNVHGHLQ